MGLSASATRSSGIPRQGPVLLPRRRSSTDGLVAVTSFVLVGLLAALLRPDVTSVLIGVAVSTVLALVIVPPVRIIVSARR